MKPGNRNSALSVGQARARLKLFDGYADAGMGLRESAHRLGISLGGLHHWLVDNNHDDIHARLVTNGRQKHRPPLRGGGDDLSRLKLIHALGQAEAAVQLDISPQAISQWLRRNYPEGVEVALREALV